MISLATKDFGKFINFSAYSIFNILRQENVKIRIFSVFQINHDLKGIIFLIMSFHLQAF